MNINIVRAAGAKMPPVLKRGIKLPDAGVKLPFMSRIEMAQTGGADRFQKTSLIQAAEAAENRIKTNNKKGNIWHLVKPKQQL